MTFSPVAPPEKLYKYRPFDVKCLDLLTQATVYYSNPRYFNDPLDCAPTLMPDIDLAGLKKLASVWLGDPEFAALPNDSDGDEEESDIDLWHTDILIEKLQAELWNELGSRGVLSLSATWSSPLLWSHYANQHQGLCIEFDATLISHPGLRPVNYEAPRSVYASDLVKWKVDGSADAAKRVYDTLFFAKARDWAYEEEWRDIADNQGEAHSPFEVSAIYFGFRCASSVRATVVALFHDKPHVAFYEVYPLRETFDLSARIMNAGEVLATERRTSALIEFRDSLRPFPASKDGHGSAQC